MNILFISFDADPPYMGGTATVVNVLAKAFQQNGHFVALGFYDETKYPSTFFKEKINLNVNNIEEVKRFFFKFNFDIIYNTQGMSTDFKYLKSLPLGNCKIISAYHNKPLLRYYPLESLMSLFYESDSFLYKLYTLAKIPLLPIWKYLSQKKERLKFEEMVRYSDKTQFLSEKFYPNLQEILPNVDKDKLIAIGNPIVFNTTYPLNELNKKEKIVIVVCSTNYQKRADLMIRIWAEIEKIDFLSDWTFEFIGGGEGFDRLKKKVLRLGLKRIIFKGYKDPEEDYKRASIFMMTSRFEGWPMVLMESMQMGVVPIVFNSFESLTDIIDDGANGCIIPNNNINEFVHRMKWLMVNDNSRIELSLNAIKSCDRYTIDKIANKYLDVFNDLILK